MIGGKDRVVDAGNNFAQTSAFFCRIQTTSVLTTETPSDIAH